MIDFVPGARIHTKPIFSRSFKKNCLSNKYYLLSTLVVIVHIHSSMHYVVYIAFALFFSLDIISTHNIHYCERMLELLIDIQVQ